MTAGWIAAGVRGRGLLRRRCGPEEGRRLASSSSLASALARLEPTPYGREIRPDMDLETAQHMVSATVVWHLRVLAGWEPPLGAGPLRLLAGGFEIANITGHLLELAGKLARTPYELGSLATAWPAVSAARTPAEARAALRSSAWGDPGSEKLPEIRLGLQFAWARRLFDGAPGTADWATAGASLLMARVLTASARSSLSPAAEQDATHLLGPEWRHATSLEDLGRHLFRGPARSLQGAGNTDQLWRAEAQWWEMVEASATSLVARSRPDASSGVGIGALLAVDAWRIRGALAMAARGGGDLAEVVDGVA